MNQFNVVHYTHFQPEISIKKSRKYPISKTGKIMYPTLTVRFEVEKIKINVEKIQNIDGFINNDIEDTWEVLSYTVATCRYPDQFCKKTGRDIVDNKYDPEINDKWIIYPFDPFVKEYVKKHITPSSVFDEANVCKDESGNFQLSVPFRFSICKRSFLKDIVKAYINEYWYS